MATSSVFEISDFMAKIDGLGSPAKRNRYTVEVTPPVSMHSPVSPGDIEFLVKTVAFPNRTFGTTTYRYGGKYALEIPYETTSENVDITFLETNSFSARRFWYDWLQWIQSTESYNMKYYDDFKGTVKISVYTETDREAVEPKHKVMLYDAWPKGMSNIELGWENSELLDFSVDIVYKKWEIQT